MIISAIPPFFFGHISWENQKFSLFYSDCNRVCLFLQVEKMCYLSMTSWYICCLCRSDGGLPERVACDLRESSIAARALPVHPEAHLRLCWGVLATAASRGQRNWSGCNLLSRYSCLQTNWFTSWPAVCIRPFAFEVKVHCGVSSSTFLKEQKV